MSMNLAGIIDNVGSLTTPVAIGISGASPIAYTITAQMKGVTFQNVGTKIVWWGGEDVDPVNFRGYKLTPLGAYQFRGATQDFSVYFICSGADGTMISFTEW